MYGARLGGLGDAAQAQRHMDDTLNMDLRDEQEYLWSVQKSGRTNALGVPERLRQFDATIRDANTPAQYGVGAVAWDAARIATERARWYAWAQAAAPGEAAPAGWVGITYQNRPSFQGPDGRIYDNSSGAAQPWRDGTPPVNTGGQVIADTTAIVQAANTAQADAAARQAADIANAAALEQQRLEAARALALSSQAKDITQHTAPAAEVGEVAAGTAQAFATAPPETPHDPTYAGWQAQASPARSASAEAVDAPAGASVPAWVWVAAGIGLYLSGSKRAA